MYLQELLILKTRINTIAQNQTDEYKNNQNKIKC